MSPIPNGDPASPSAKLRQPTSCGEWSRTPADGSERGERAGLGMIALDRGCGTVIRGCDHRRRPGQHGSQPSGPRGDVAAHVVVFHHGDVGAVPSIRLLRGKRMNRSKGSGGESIPPKHKAPSPPHPYRALADDAGVRPDRQHDSDSCAAGRGKRPARIQAPVPPRP